MKYAEAPFTLNASEAEDISLVTGNLSLKFEDIVLPGVNGLDFKITRRYQSNNSNRTIPVPEIIQNYNREVYYTDTIANNQAYNLYWLGYGWQLEIPFIEKIYGNYRITQTSVSSPKEYKYLNLGNGESY